MKNIKFLVIFAITLIFSLGLSSCIGEAPCKVHTDGNEDGICDVCESSLQNDDTEEGGENAVTLIKNGEAQFQFVCSSDISSKCYADISKIAAELDNLGIKVKTVLDGSSNKMDCEVLIGNVTTRGEKYIFNGYEYGNKGYAIKIFDKKIILVGGSQAALEKAIGAFKTDVLGLKSDTEVLMNVSVPFDAGIERKQENFDIPSMTIGSGTLDKTYVINASTEISYINNAAISLREVIYEKTGFYLEIINDPNTTEKCFIIRKVADAGSDGFRIYVSKNSLIIETEFTNKLDSAFTRFVESNITAKFEAVNFKNSFRYSENVRIIRYTEFGAKADGVTNDFGAIKAAHEYANKYNHTVVADSGTYYIGLTGGRVIPIQTDTDWTGATFIIDDTCVEWYDNTNREANVFCLSTSNPSLYHAADSELVKALNRDGLTRETTSIDYKPGHKIMIIPYDSTHKAYIRWGANGNAGKEQSEIIIIDAEGNIDKDTPVLLDYTTVTHVLEYNVDEQLGDVPIKLTGGKIITKANRAPRMYKYYCRGIQIKRSNVTIEGMEHVIEGESLSHEYGAPYSGFFSLSYCNNFLAKNCILQSHLTHNDIDAPQYGVQYNNTKMGSYDIGGSYFNLAKFENCTESNFYTDSTKTAVRSTGEYWGIMGTNYSKNIIYKDSTLSRLDAHAGVYNATVDNCSIIQINLIGGGTALIKDTTVYNDTLISLRDDYGSTWNGDIIVQNVHMMNSASSSRNITIISATWHEWNFGYEVYLPLSVTIDNLTVENKKQIYVLGNYIGDAGNDLDRVLNSQVNKPHITKEITIKNNASGLSFVASINQSLSKEIPLTEKSGES